MTGRVDDIINVAGHRLSTMEMESAIMECGGIAEVAVVGMPDAIKGTVPAAFVTLKAGQSSSPAMEQAIRQQVATTISRIAVPERVIFTDVLPKTPSGKIMRRLLKEIMTSGDVGSDRHGARGCTGGREAEGAGAREPADAGLQSLLSRHNIQADIVGKPQRRRANARLWAPQDRAEAPLPLCYINNTS